MYTLTGSRVRCSSPCRRNSSSAEPFGVARTSVRPRFRGSDLVRRRAGRSGSDTCSWPASGCGPGRSCVRCGCGPRSCSQICIAGRTSGNVGATARTLLGCRPRTPVKRYRSVAPKPFENCVKKSKLLCLDAHHFSKSRSKITENQCRVELFYFIIFLTEILLADSTVHEPQAVHLQNLNWTQVAQKNSILHATAEIRFKYVS